MHRITLITPTWHLLRRWRLTACNKITDAGVCEQHSGSTRILFQEADRPMMVERWAGTAVQMSSCSLVSEVVFVQVQQSRCNVTRHLLKNQRLWGHVLCSPAALKVALHISLDRTQQWERPMCYNLWPLEGSVVIAFHLTEQDISFLKIIKNRPGIRSWNPAPDELTNLVFCSFKDLIWPSEQIGFLFLKTWNFLSLIL